jgi:hypothetical protein
LIWLVDSSFSICRYMPCEKKFSSIKKTLSAALNIKLTP